MKLVFMGTPDIAAASLRALAGSGHEILAVYTREDKPVGRRQTLTPPPVKVLAQSLGIPVHQPRTLKTQEAAETIAALRPELVVVVAYGRILPPDILAVPQNGCINLHVSLLPQYRGAAPVQWAVINGESTTGVTIMQLDEGLDTGPLLAQETIEIQPDETAGELFKKVTETGARLLCRTVEEIAAGCICPHPQEGEVTLAPPLHKEMAKIDFTLPALRLHNLARGCSPWPLAWFMQGGKRIKLLRTAASAGKGQPGEILALNPLIVACGEGALVLREILPEGSRAMAGAEWALGRRFAAGDNLAPGQD